jgi:hypothetical protein
MFIETPEARRIPTEPLRKERFVIEFAGWNVWTITDTHGHWRPRAFALRAHAEMHRRGLEAYVRGDEKEAAELLDGASRMQERQRRASYLL